MPPWSFVRVPNGRPRTSSSPPLRGGGVVSCFWGAGGSAARECARGARPRTRPPGGKGARSGSPLPTDMSPATIASVLTAAPLATVRRTATSDRRGRGGPSHGAGDRSPPLRTPPARGRPRRPEPAWRRGGCRAGAERRANGRAGRANPGGRTARGACLRRPSLGKGGFTSTEPPCQAHGQRVVHPEVGADRMETDSQTAKPAVDWSTWGHFGRGDSSPPE